MGAVDIRKNQKEKNNGKNISIIIGLITVLIILIK